MNTKKVAITMPKNLVAMVDTIRKDQGLSRSRFISKVVEEKISDERDRHLKEAFDRVFSDDSIRKEQLDTSRWFQASESEEGQEW
jgi:hypothetical protein